VLSYDAYVLHNWRRLDGTQRLRPHDLDSITTFTDLRDERWFIGIHAAIEAAAGPALAAIGQAQRGILDRDTDRVHRALRSIEESLHVIVPILDRMGEHNDPEMYGEGFRPYLGALTGVEFEGVADLEGTQSFRGASGAQSSIFPALDAAFGIDHGDTPLVDHLHSLRQDMPPEHRAFIQAAADGPAIKAFAERTGDSDVREAYNECIDQMVHFRERHYDVVEQYLASKLGETTGTGGTPYGDFLAMFTDNTRALRLGD
jgi:indoleamine 2,3-dioxygenase